MAQFMQPEDQTSFLASRCVHAPSAQAALGLTSTKLGQGLKKGKDGRIERERYVGRVRKMGAMSRSMKLI
jgi:hypothetical protein